MGAGMKVGLLGAALVAAILLVVGLAGGPDPAPPREAAPADAPSLASAPAERPAGPPGRIAKPRHEKPSHEKQGAAPRGTGDVRLSGRVTDDEERPVAGAAARALRGVVLADETKTDADGRFVLRCGRRPATGSADIGVTVASGPARAAFEVYELMEDSPDEDDLGDLVLEAAVPLTARIVDAAGPVAGAQVFVGSFFGAVFSAATADEKGVARFETSPGADAWLFAYAPGRGRARGEIPDGRDPKVPLVLSLTARTLTVSVVATPAQAPLPGEVVAARVTTDADRSRLFSSFVPPLALPPSDAGGLVRIDDVAAEDAVELRRVAPEAAREPWRFTGHVARPVIAGPREIEVRIDVPSGRTVRWRIVTGDAPVPAEGTVVDLRRGVHGALPAGPLSLRVEGAELAGYGFADGDVRGVAVAPDGSMARLAGPGGEARFMRPRSVGVLVLDAEGRPVPGVEISLRIGNVREAAGARRTGEDGRVRFADLEPDLGLLDVWAKTDAPPDARWVAAVDLAKGDANVRIRLPRTREVVLRVTTDGERRLPPAWRLLVNQTWEASATTDAPSDIRLVVRERSPGEPVRVVLRADGWNDAEADVSCAPGDGPLVAELALVRGVTLWADFRPPPQAALRETYVQAQLERWSEDARQWLAWRDRPLLGAQRPRETDGRYRFDAMPPGRYRIGGFVPAASDTVEIAAGVAPAELRLDLSNAGLVRVLVVAPDEKPVIDAWVTVEDARPGAPADAARPVGSGRAIPFRDGVPVRDAGVQVLVPGDRPVRLVARHALHRPDPERGSVEVTEPGGEHVLRLIEGPVIVFTAPPVADASSRVNDGPAGRGVVASWSLVQLFRGAAEGEPAAVLNPVLADGRMRAGGFAPGRYTIWIRVPGGAPVVIPDADLATGVNDLGELKPRRGSSVRLRIAVPEGQVAPRLTVTAVRLDPPRYTLSVQSNGEAEIVIPGLGAGRFEVTARQPSNPSETTLRRVVETDGERDVVIDSSQR